MLTSSKYLTREYPQHRRTGMRYIAVCQNSLPYPYPRDPFWNHRGFTRTRSKP